MSWRLSFTLQDNNRKEADTGIWLPASASFDLAEAYVQLLEPAIAGLSSARIERAVFERELRERNFAPISPDADMLTDLILIYRDGNVAATFRVPSPRAVLFETTGPYTGVRVTRDRLNVLGLLSTFDNMLTGAIDALGRPFPATFVVGGRAGK